MPRKMSALVRSSTSSPGRSMMRNNREKPVDGAVDDAPGWMTKGRENIAAKNTRGGGKDFAPLVPEFFLSDGETALIKIIDPVADLERSVARHNYRHFGKSGKPYYRAFTCSGSPKTCAGCANGDRPTLRWPLQIIDTRLIEYGEWDAKTKKRVPVKKKDVVKLWLPSVNELERFLAAKEDFEESAQLGKRILVKVRRTGQGPQTAYSFIIKQTGIILTAQDKAAIDKFNATFGDLTKMLTPLPYAEQEALITSTDEAPQRGRGKPSRPTDDDEDVEDASVEY